MPYPLVVAALIVTMVFLVIGCSTRAPAEAPKSPPTTAAPAAAAAPTPNIARSRLSRADLAKKLTELARKPAPAGLEVGAMCYTRAATLLDPVQYVCPICGEKTVYAQVPGPDVSPLARIGWHEQVRSGIPACRRLLKGIRALKLALDERDFCRRCRPDVKAPVLRLLIWFTDQQEPRCVDGVGVTGLQVLSEFLAGKDRHVESTGDESALKEHLGRLEWLLGVKAEDAT